MSQTQPSSITATPQDAPPRCQHRTLKGRCRQLATDNAGTLCFHHARAQRLAKDDFTLLEPLVRKLEDLQSVEGISEDLAALHNLLAEGRISPRRASVLAFIDSMLLQTVREIAQQAKGNLNWYGQPIPKYDYSRLQPMSDSTASPVPEVQAEPSSNHLPKNSAMLGASFAPPTP